MIVEPSRLWDGFLFEWVDLIGSHINSFTYKLVRVAGNTATW